MVRQAQQLAFNTLLLTAASFLMQAAGIIFQVYIGTQIGSQGIGLWQLTLSVYALAVTLATSGVRFASTRLVAQELGQNHYLGARAVVTRCLWYAALFGMGAGGLLWIGSTHCATYWVEDSRCALSLRILAFGLPFLSMGAALGGYFIAVQRVLKSAVSQTLEQVVRMGIVIGIFFFYNPKALNQSCAIIAAGTVAGEIASLSLIWGLYILDRQRYHHPGPPPNVITLRLLYTALPVAFSTYARTALSSLQHLLIPRSLCKSGTSFQNALVSYGIIHGMVLPIVLFPSALLTTLAELLIPELTRCQVMGRQTQVDYMVERVFCLGLLFSFGIAGLIWGFSKELGQCIYGNLEASRYLRVLAPLIPVMYMDMLTDGMLKGLGEQVASMRYNIIDSMCSVALVYLLLPHFGVGGYIFTIWFTEALNFALSVGKLLRITNVSIHLGKDILRPTGCVAIAAVFCPIFTALTGISWEGAGMLAVQIFLAGCIYFGLLIITKAITFEDIQWFAGLVGILKC